MVKSKTAKEIGEEFATELSNLVNAYSKEAQTAALVKMIREHRTCQQSIMRFFMQFVEAMATNGYDLRNEASVFLANEIMEIDPQKRALPYV